MTEFYTEGGKITGLVNGEIVSGDFSFNGKNFNNSLTFTSNPKEVTANGSLTITISITALGKIIYKNTDTSTNEGEKSSWSLQDNVITIDTDKFEIISFDNNILRLSAIFTEGLFSYETKITENQHITFVKQ